MVQPLDAIKIIIIILQSFLLVYLFIEFSSPSPPNLPLSQAELFNQKTLHATRKLLLLRQTLHDCLNRTLCPRPDNNVPFTLLQKLPPINPCFSLNFRRYCLPHFIIAGAGKSGTSSLVHWLIRHPQIKFNMMKWGVQTQYFMKTSLYQQGLLYYTRHFPSFPERPQKFEKRGGVPELVTGEKTPFYYNSPPAVVRRIRAALPNVKLIFILREPVSRLQSHLKMHLRNNLNNGYNWGRTLSQVTRLTEDNFTQSYFMRASTYVDELKKWLALFPREQILVLRSEDMFNEPEKILLRITRFLGLDDFEWGRLGFERVNEAPKVNQGQDEAVDLETYEIPLQHKKRFSLYFEKKNRQLEDLLGWEVQWRNYL